MTVCLFVCLFVFLFVELSILLPDNPAIALWGVYPSKMKSNILYTNVNSSFNHNRQKTAATQMSFNG